VFGNTAWPAIEEKKRKEIKTAIFRNLRMFVIKFHQEKKYFKKQAGISRIAIEYNTSL